MATAYYYLRDGQKHGPFPASRLGELAAAGELKRDDLVWREGMAKWEPAAKLKGLFPAEPIAKQSAAPPPVPVASTPPPAGPEVAPPTDPPPATPPAPKPDRFAAFRPVVYRYAVEFGIGATQLLAAAGGAACLVLMLLATLMTWETDYVTMVRFADSKSWAGLEVFEGKFVAFLSLAALILAGVTLAVRKLFPLTLVAAGAVATCSVFLTFSYLHLINKAQAEDDRELRAIYGNVGRSEAKSPEEAAQGAKAAEATLNVTSKYTAGLGLYLATLLALIAAPALAYAGFFKPIPVAFLQKEGVSPFVRQHGVLLIAQAVAILVGLGIYVYRY